MFNRVSCRNRGYIHLRPSHPQSQKKRSNVTKRRHSRIARLPRSNPNSMLSCRRVSVADRPKNRKMQKSQHSRPSSPNYAAAVGRHVGTRRQVAVKLVSENPVGYSHTVPVGFEPTTSRLTATRSTPELWNQGPTENRTRILRVRISRPNHWTIGPE